MLQLNFGTIKQKSQAFYRKFKLKYAVPFLLLTAYTCLGALIFYVAERNQDVELREEYRKDYDAAMFQIKERLVEIKYDPLIKDHGLVHNRTSHAIDWFCTKLRIKELVKDRLKPTPWSWWGAMFYAGTLYTTIGYGHYATVTRVGRLCTCLYTVVGIPIFLLIMKDAGEMLSRLARKYYKKCLRTWLKLRNWCRARDWRRSSTSISMITSVVDEKGRKRAPIPIALALGMLILWVFVAGGFFCIYEDWGYFTAIYFFFVSISTVGLGDVVPTNPDMMLANFLLILIGLALLSMCFNLIQMWIEALLEDMMQQFIDEFEKITNVMKPDEQHPVEIGISGSLATAPLQMTKMNAKTTNAKSWFTSHLASTIMAKRRKTLISEMSANSDNSDSDSDTSDTEEVERGKAKPAEGDLKAATAFKIMQNRAEAGGLKGQLFSRFMNTNRLQNLEQKIQEKISKANVGVQTENEFTEILEFLSIPKRTETTQMSAETATIKSDMTANTLYFTAKDTTPERSKALSESPVKDIYDWKNDSLFDDYDDETVIPSTSIGEIPMTHSFSPDSGTSEFSPASEYRRAVKNQMSSSDEEQEDGNGDDSPDSQEKRHRSTSDYDSMQISVTDSTTSQDKSELEPLATADIMLKIPEEEELLDDKELTTLISDSDDYKQISEPMDENKKTIDYSMPEGKPLLADKQNTDQNPPIDSIEEPVQQLPTSGKDMQIIVTVEPEEEEEEEEEEIEPLIQRNTLPDIRIDMEFEPPAQAEEVLVISDDDDDDAGQIFSKLTPTTAKEDSMQIPDPVAKVIQPSALSTSTKDAVQISTPNKPKDKQQITSNNDLQKSPYNNKRQSSSSSSESSGHSVVVEPEIQSSNSGNHIAKDNNFRSIHISGEDDMQISEPVLKTKETNSKFPISIAMPSSSEEEENQSLRKFSLTEEVFNDLAGRIKFIDDRLSSRGTSAEPESDKTQENVALIHQISNNLSEKSTESDHLV